HLDLIRLVLQSFGGKATLEQIQQVLVPDIIADDWKKWWEVARNEMKKDGHFQVPLKKTAPIVYQAKETSLDERLLEDFRAAKVLKNKLVIAHEMLKNINDLTNRPGTVGEIINALNADIISHQRTQPSLALEAVFLRDEVREAAGLPAQGNELNDTGIWTQVTKPAQALESIPASKHKRALQSFKKAHPDTWADVLLINL